MTEAEAAMVARLLNEITRLRGCIEGIRDAPQTLPRWTKWRE